MSEDKNKSRELFLYLNKGCNEDKVICCTSVYEEKEDEKKIARQGAALKPAKIFSQGEECGKAMLQKELVIAKKREAPPGSWPWLAVLGYTNAIGEVSFKCGGTIITKKHILTAATCVRSDLHLVRLGEHDLRNSAKDIQEVEIEEKIIHPEYKKRDGSNDIAILVLADDIEFSDTIEPICGHLPEEAISFLERNLPLAGIKLYEAGWGLSINGQNELGAIMEQSVETKNCTLNEDRSYLIGAIDENSSTKCAADSGGVLMLQYVAHSKHHFYPISLVSYTKDCRRSVEITKYVSIYKYLQWIEDTVNRK
jgi:hypothetical protein